MAAALPALPSSHEQHPDGTASSADRETRVLVVAVGGWCGDHGEPGRRSGRRSFLTRQVASVGVRMMARGAWWVATADRTLNRSR